jgi:hypothetical protein
MAKSAKFKSKMAGSWPRPNSGMGTLVDAKSIFDKFAEQIDASVSEFNSLRGSRWLYCRRTSNGIAVYKELPPLVTVELEFDKVAGTVRMRRQKLEHPSSGQAGAVVTDLRYSVDRKNQVYLDRADYCRLALQALRPLMDAFE